MNKYLLLFCVLCLTACNDKQYTVKDFFHDDNIRATYINKCENGEIRPEELNCLNSKKAEDIKGRITRLEESKSKVTTEQAKRDIQAKIDDFYSKVAK